MQQSVKQKLVLRSVNRIEPGDYRDALASSSLWAETELPQPSFYADRNKHVPRDAIRRHSPF